MNAHKALTLSNGNKIIYVKKGYSDIEQRIKDAIKAGKTEICFSDRTLPPQDTIDSFRKQGYNWFVMKGMFMPFPIYTLSWAIEDKPKSILSKILSKFKRR